MHCLWQLCGSLLLATVQVWLPRLDRLQTATWSACPAMVQVHLRQAAGHREHQQQQVEHPEWGRLKVQPRRGKVERWLLVNQISQRFLGTTRSME